MTAHSEFLPDPLPAEPLEVAERVAGGGVRSAAAAQSQRHGAGHGGPTDSPPRASCCARTSCRSRDTCVFYTNYLSRKGSSSKRQPARRGRHALGRAASAGAGRGPDRQRARRRQRRVLRLARLAEAAWAPGPASRASRVASRAALQEAVADSAARFGTPVPGTPGADERVDHRCRARRTGAATACGRKRWSCGSRATRAFMTARAGRARSRARADGSFKSRSLVRHRLQP